MIPPTFSLATKSLFFRIEVIAAILQLISPLWKNKKKICKNVGQECIKIFYLQPTDTPADDHGAESQQRIFLWPQFSGLRS